MSLTLLPLVPTEESPSSFLKLNSAHGCPLLSNLPAFLSLSLFWPHLLAPEILHLPPFHGLNHLSALLLPSAILHCLPHINSALFLCCHPPLPRYFVDPSSPESSMTSEFLSPLAAVGFVPLDGPRDVEPLTTFSFWKPLFPWASLHSSTLLTVLVLILPCQAPLPHSLPPVFGGD